MSFKMKGFSGFKESPIKSKEYRGVLKARVSKIYGGEVTVDKARKLKARKKCNTKR